MFQSTLLVAAALLSVPARADHIVHDEIAHAPASAPGTIAIVVDGLSATTGFSGRHLKKEKHCKKFKEDKLTEDKAPKHEKSKTKKSKASKKTKEKSKLTEDKVLKSKSKKHKEKECEEWDYVDNRLPLQTECANLMEEDKPVEVLVVSYNYTIEMDVGESISSTIRDMEGKIHDTIVSDQLRCEDPVLRRRLGGIRHSRNLFFNTQDNEQQLKIVGTDPSPSDKKSQTSTCYSLSFCFK